MRLVYLHSGPLGLLANARGAVARQVPAVGQAGIGPCVPTCRPVPAPSDGIQAGYRNLLTVTDFGGRLPAC